MVDIGVVMKLSKAFPGGFLNGIGEYIAHKKANVYCNLANCETELDVKCKVLEWFSRAAYKSTPFHRPRDNTALHTFMLNGICTFLEHPFSPEDMEQIYTYLGNAVDHQKTIRFIESRYDMSILDAQRMLDCPLCRKPEVFIGVHDDEGNYHGRQGCEYESDPWSGLSYALHHEAWGQCPLCTGGAETVMGGMLFDTATEAQKALKGEHNG